MDKLRPGHPTTQTQEATVPGTFARRAVLALAFAASAAAVHAQDTIKLTVKEVNAAGGILGKKIASTVADTQTQSGVARAWPPRRPTMAPSPSSARCSRVRSWSA